MSEHAIRSEREQKKGLTHLHIILPRRLYDSIRRRAFEEGTTVSDLVRGAVRGLVPDPESKAGGEDPTVPHGMDGVTSIWGGPGRAENV